MNCPLCGKRLNLNASHVCPEAKSSYKRTAAECEETVPAPAPGYVPPFQITPSDESENGVGCGAGGVKPLRILVAFECSGAIRRELRAMGHKAWSCDLNPARDYSPHHYQCDVRDLLQLTPHPMWDALLAIGPDCTYLTNSAAWAYKEPDFVRYPGFGYHQRLKPGTLTGAERRMARVNAIELVRGLWDCGIERVAIENPIGVLSTSFLRPSQIIHPWMFGDDASKATCLWLKNLPPLVPEPSMEIPPRWVCQTCGRTAGKARLSYCPAGVACAGCGCATRPRWANQTDSGQNNLSPADDRAEMRAMTYRGVAAAMATQWFGGRWGLGRGDTLAAAEKGHNARISDGEDTAT